MKLEAKRFYQLCKDKKELNEIANYLSDINPRDINICFDLEEVYKWVSLLDKFKIWTISEIKHKNKGVNIINDSMYYR